MAETTYNLNFISREKAIEELRQAGSSFYVYVLGKPDKTPFYVGKGCHKRVFQHENEARLNNILLSHKINVIRKIHRENNQVLYAFAGFFADEKEALQFERDLIQAIGRYDLKTGTLTNQTDGGEGTSNPSEESLSRRLASLGGESEDPERRIANEFFNSIYSRQESVPIKPVSAWIKTVRPLILRKPVILGGSLRMAKAITASVLANKLILKPNIDIPRLLVINEVQFIIENGCGCDMIDAGLLEPPQENASNLEEKMKLTEYGFEFICREIGNRRLIELGVLEP